MLKKLFKKKETEKLKTAFAPYLQPSEIDNILVAPPSQMELREIACLVIEFINYEEVCQHVELVHIGKIMNQIYSIVGEIAIQDGGDANQFFGQKVLILYGLFENVSAATVVNSALSIFENVKKIKSEINDIELQFGLGVCLGQVIIGSFGDKRKVYTGFGMPISCADKLARKSNGVNICNAMADTVADKFLQNKAIQVHKCH